MANTIKIKRSAVTATPATLAEGELAYSELSGNLFIGTNGGADLVKIGGKTDVDKIAGIEAGADVTDTANVTAAGALMDSELASVTAVKATTGTFLVADQTKLDGIEALADVTDATNVAAAGAVMEGDTTTALMSFVIDEDTMASNLATKVPTQQSVKAYVDSGIASALTSEMTYKGGYNATTNVPNLDAASPVAIAKGDTYTVTVAGTFFTTAVEIGDMIIAEKASATLEADWTIVNKNLDNDSILAAVHAVKASTGTTDTFVMATSPTLVTPVLGVATATTLNKVTVTQPATGSTLTIVNGATLTASATATVSGTNTGDNAVNSLYSGLNTNVPTSLSVGTVTANTVGITSDGGADDVIIPAATASSAGLLTTAKWAEIVANTAKVTNVSTNLSVGTVTATNVPILSSDGTDIATLPAATSALAGIVTNGAQTFGGVKTFASTISGSITGNAGTVTNGVYTARTISTTAPLTGGGDLSANRTLGITAATQIAAGSMSSADKTKLDAISGSNSGDEVSATLTVQGIIELATQEEVNTGTDAVRAVTPSTLAGASLDGGSF